MTPAGVTTALLAVIMGGNAPRDDALLVDATWRHNDARFSASLQIHTKPHKMPENARFKHRTGVVMPMGVWVKN